METGRISEDQKISLLIDQWAQDLQDQQLSDQQLEYVIRELRRREVTRDRPARSFSVKPELQCRLFRKLYEEIAGSQPTDDGDGGRAALLVRLTCETPLSTARIVSLKEEDFDNIGEIDSGRGAIPILRSLVSELAAHCIMQPSSYLFPSRRSQEGHEDHISPRRANQILAEVREDAGVELASQLNKVQPSTMMHAKTRLLWALGMGVERISMVVGVDVTDLKRDYELTPLDMPVETFVNAEECSRGRA